MVCSFESFTSDDSNYSYREWHCFFVASSNQHDQPTGAGSGLEFMNCLALMELTIINSQSKYKDSGCWSWAQMVPLLTILRLELSIKSQHTSYKPKRRVEPI